MSLKDFKYLARFLAAKRSKRENACYAGSVLFLTVLLRVMQLYNPFNFLLFENNVIGARETSKRGPQVRGLPSWTWSMDYNRGPLSWTTRNFPRAMNGGLGHYGLDFIYRFFLHVHAQKCFFCSM